MGDKLKKDSDMSEFISKITNYNACQESIDWALQDKFKNKTINDTTSNFANEIKPQWAIWLFRNYYDYLGEDFRQFLLTKVTDEMMAFRLYTKVENLSEIDAATLLSKFEGKLPNAEKQLKKKSKLE